MENPGTPTFDKLRIFLTVVDSGRFAASVLAPPTSMRSWWLAGVLRGFVAAFPIVQLRLHVQAVEASNAMVLARTAILETSGALAAEDAEVEVSPRSRIRRGPR
jgi:DNA-binding transcriptional LysR family regulator